MGFVGDEAFAKMKDGVRIVNAARGGIVDEAALQRALESGKVASAGLDVYSKEPPDPDFPLFKFDNVVCTPHLGASTEEAQDRAGTIIAEQVTAGSSGRVRVERGEHPARVGRGDGGPRAVPAPGRDAGQAARGRGRRPGRASSPCATRAVSPSTTAGC